MTTSSVANRRGKPSVWHRWRDHVFGTVYLMARKSGSSSSSALTVLSIAVEVLQMLYYPLLHLSDAIWLSMVNSPIHPSNPSTRDLVPAGFWTAFTWTAIFLMVVGTVVAMFAMGRRQQPGVLKFINSTALLTTGPLFIPFAEQLLFGIGCEGGENPKWWIVDEPCWGGAHAVVTIITVTLFALLCLVSLFIMSTLRVSSGGSSQLHGRNDTALVGFKIVVVVMVTYADLSPTAFGLMYLVGGITYMVLNLRAPGESSLQAVHLRVMFGGLFTWAAVGVIAAECTTRDQGQTVFLWGAAAAAASSYFMSVHWFSTHVNKMITAELFAWLSNPLLAKAGLLHGYVAPTGAPPAAKVQPVGGMGGGASVGFGGDSASMLDPNDDQGTVVSSLAGHTTAARRRRQSTESAALGGVPEFVNKIVDDMQAVSNSTAMSLYAMSHYHAVVTKRRFMEINLLRAVSLHDPPLDLQFIVYSRLRSHMEDSAGQGVRGIDRVLFDQHRDANEVALRDCYNVRAELWGYIQSFEPDVAQVVKFAYTFERCASSALSHMHAMMGLYPQSVEVLRLLALFHAELEPNKQRYEKYISMQRRQREAQSKHNKAVLSRMRLMMRSKEEVNVMADDACVFQISAEASSVGEIVSASRGVRAVFGRHPNSLVGDNISSIMPSPFREVHDTFLLQYISKGVGKIMNNTSLVVAIAAGHSLKPFWMTLRESPPMEGDTRPLFVGVMQAVEAEEGHMLVTSGETGYRVIAGCQKTQVLLGIDGEELMEDRPSLGRWIADFAQGTVQGGDADQEFRAQVVDETLASEVMPVEVVFRVQVMAFRGVEPAMFVTWRPTAAVIPVANRRVSAVAGAKEESAVGTVAKGEYIEDAKEDGSVDVVTEEETIVEAVSKEGSVVDALAAAMTADGSKRPLPQAHSSQSLSAAGSSGGGGGSDRSSTSSGASSPGTVVEADPTPDAMHDTNSQVVMGAKVEPDFTGTGPGPVCAKSFAVSKRDGGSVAANTLKPLMAALRGVRDSVPPQVLKVKFIYGLMFFFMIAFGAVLWHFAQLNLNKLGDSLEIMHDITYLDAARSMLTGSTLVLAIQRMGWSLPDSRIDADAVRYREQAARMGEGLEALSVRVTSDWPDLEEFWAKELFTLDPLQSGAQTLPEVTRYTERLLAEFAVAYPTSPDVCPNVDMVHITNVIGNTDLTMFYEDPAGIMVEATDKVQNDLLTAVGVLVASLMVVFLLVLLLLVMPVFRSLASQTTNILEQVVLLPKRSVAFLQERAMEQRDAYSGQLSAELAAFNADDSDDDAETVRRSQNASTRDLTNNRRSSMESTTAGSGKKKRFRNTWRFVTCTMLMFVGPLIMTLGCTGVLFLLSDDFIKADREIRHHLHHADTMIMHNQNLRTVTLHSIPESGATIIFADYQAAFAKFITDTERLLSLGGEDSGPLPADSFFATTMFEDGCPAAIGGGFEDILRDTSVLGSCQTVTGLGLSAAMQWSVREMQDFYNGTTPCAGPATETSAELSTWLAVNDDVLNALMNVYIDTHEDAKALHRSFALKFRGLMVCFMTFSAIVFALLSMHVSRQVHRVMRLTATMLLMLPEDVLERNPQLLKQAKNFVAGQHK